MPALGLVKPCGQLEALLCRHGPTIPVPITLFRAMVGQNAPLGRPPRPPQGSILISGDLKGFFLVAMPRNGQQCLGMVTLGSSREKPNSYQLS